MFTEGIFAIGDGLLDIDETRFKGLLVPHDINEIYDVEQTPFARGKFAAVRRAIHKNSGVHFAAKFLKRRRRAQSSDREIKHEIAVLMLCDGADNIVKLNAVHESRSDTALLLELATGGELQTFLDNEECLSEAQARICMREVLKALQFLHKRSIAHLDLKPQNILLTSERIEDGLKLCDFGISRVVAEGTNVREIVGTPDYVAPEVLQYEPLSLLTDIWSVGVLTYVLLSGFSPFGGETKQETFLNISQCALTFPDKLFGGVSSAAIDFMRRALRIKPNDRMTAAGCLEHIWLKDECSIDRQIFNKIAKKTATTKDVDEDEMAHDHVDDCDDDDGCDVEDEEEEEEEEVDECDESIEVEHNEETGEGEVVVDNELLMVNGDEIDEEEHEETDDNNELLMLNGNNKMDSSDAEQENQQHIVSNGKVAHNKAKATTNGTTATKYTNGINGKSPNATKMQTTTAIVTVPTIRAITIPLPHHHSNELQQQPWLAARRHSSGSNKENTFLATKKILPSMSNKKPIATAATTAAAATTTTSTATAIIIIAPPTESTTSTPSSATTTSNVVATITLPNGGCVSNSNSNSNSNNSSNGNDKNATSAAAVAAAAAQCFFPDAPTTPKVIRKAPTTDTSPTSVKALVKKFQLEGNNCEKSPPHLKETQATNHQQQQQQQHTNGISHNGIDRRSTTSPVTNGKISVKSLEKQCSHVEQTKKMNANNSNHHHINTSNCNMHHSSISNGGRRSSEPITAVHKKILPTSATVTASATVPIATTNVTSYKSTSVYCLTCGSTSSTITTTGCRHSGAAASVTTNGSNNSTASSSPTTTNGSSSSTSAAAILLSNHQQLQHHHHHHHHHHHVAKNGANNLSLDQGIIC